MTDNIIQLPLKMSPGLEAQISLFNRQPDPQYADRDPLLPVHDPAAADWLQRKRKQLQPGTRDDCKEWLIRLVLGINGVSEEAFKGREEAVWERCADVPGFTWCKATRQTMQDRTPFLPSPGEVYAVLSEHAAPLKREIAALERIVSAPKLREVILPPYQPPTDTPEWTKSRGRPGFSTDPGIPSLGDAVRQVTEHLAALKKQEPSSPEAAD
jgi:hypothetical protein